MKNITLFLCVVLLSLTSVTVLQATKHPSCTLEVSVNPPVKPGAKNSKTNKYLKKQQRKTKKEPWRWSSGIALGGAVALFFVAFQLIYWLPFLYIWFVGGFFAVIAALLIWWIAKKAKERWEGAGKQHIINIPLLLLGLAGFFVGSFGVLFIVYAPLGGLFYGVLPIFLAMLCFSLVFVLAIKVK